MAINWTTIDTGDLDTIINKLTKLGIMLQLPSGLKCPISATRQKSKNSSGYPIKRVPKENMQTIHTVSIIRTMEDATIKCMTQRTATNTRQTVLPQNI